MAQPEVDNPKKQLLVILMQTCIERFKSLNVTQPELNATIGGECSEAAFEAILANVDASAVKNTTSTKYTLIMLAYLLIVLISFFGNVFVIGICFGKRRMRTTVNIFIGNLAASDLLMTVFNIPFACARLLLDDWPFGDLLCHVVPFVQATSVYVSTLTMTFIAIDRYQAIIWPIRRRMSTKLGHGTVLLIIWCLAIFFSTPFALFNRVQAVSLSYKTMIRCKPLYPEPSDLYAKAINAVTFSGQFALPLTIMIALYAQIAIRIWARKTIGKSTVNFFVLFALCLSCTFLSNRSHDGGATAAARDCEA